MNRPHMNQCGTTPQLKVLEKLEVQYYSQFQLFKCHPGEARQRSVLIGQ